MKRLLLYLAVIGVLFSSGCTQRYFVYTVNISPSGTWRIDQTGSFSSVSTINASLNLPEDANILDVNIESLTLKPRALPGHTAISVTAKGSFWDGLTRTDLFPEQTMPLLLEFIPEELITEGIGKLKQLIIDFVKGRGFPYASNVTLTGRVTGGRALLEIDFSINATVRYGVCEEVLDAMGDIGQSCAAH